MVQNAARIEIPVLGCLIVTILRGLRVARTRHRLAGVGVEFAPAGFCEGCPGFEKHFDGDAADSQSN